LPPRGPHDPKWGTESCPCIGISGVQGEFTVLIEVNKTGETTNAQYPADVGSFCKTWDDGLDPIHCQEGQHPGKGNDWCAQPWCFVDACNCDGIPSPPKVSQMLPTVVYEGRILYYSYATCGGEDRWTVDHNAHACVLAETEEDCMDQKDGNCVWGETTWGEKCLGWEAGGLCTDLPKQSEWGDHDCPCIGFGDVNGTLRIPVDGATLEYPGDLGSVCRPWHMDHLPECVGDNKAEWCNDPWCFVDVDRCTSVASRPSKYLPDAMWNGHKLYYSYETCGSKGPEPDAPAPAPAPAQAETTAAPAAAAPAAAAPAAAEKPVDKDNSPDEDVQEDEDEEQEEDEDQQPEVPGDDKDESEDDKLEEMSENDEHIVDAEEKKLHKTMPEYGAPSDGMGVEFDNDAYKEEWSNEWRHGSVPAFRDLYPQAQKYEDRQSDGKASAVPSGLR